MADTTPKWTVTNQLETTKPNAAGQYVDGVSVSFQTANGLIGSIFVPHTQYNPENVKGLINAKVEAMQSIQGLKG